MTEFLKELCLQKSFQEQCYLLHATLEIFISYKVSFQGVQNGKQHFRFVLLHTRKLPRL